MGVINGRRNTSQCNCGKKVLRFESLESRELLSATDAQVLIEQGFDNTANESTIYVTTNQDVTNSGDGLISLREAIDYASSNGTTIRFSCSGTIELNSTLVIRKSIDLIAGSTSIVLSPKGESRIMEIGDSDITVSLDNFIFRDGKAVQSGDIISTGQGGAIQIVSGAEVLLNRCQFLDNESSDSGGAIYSSGHITIQDSIFENNIAGNHGGALAVNLGSITDNNVFVSIDSSVFRGNSAQNYGGSLYFNAVSVTSSEVVKMIDTIISKSSATKGGAIYNENSPLSIIDSQIINNTASLQGGGLYISSSNSFLKIESTEVIQNQAFKGGGLYNSGYTLSFTNIYSGNTSLGNKTSSWGGGIYNTSVVYSKGDQYLANQSEGLGGGIYNYGTFESTNSAQFTIIDAVINDNTAGGSNSEGGGAIYNQGTVLLRNSTLTNNRTQQSEYLYGGAICNTDTGTLDIYSSVFADNYAYQGGGAIDNAGILNIDNTTFLQNKTEWESLLASGYVESGGGAICNKSYGQLTIANTLLLSNLSYFGGAIRNWANTYSTESSHGFVKMTNTSCRENIDYNGMGIFSNYNYTVDGSKIEYYMTWAGYRESFTENSNLVLRDTQGNIIDRTIVFKSQALSAKGQSITLVLYNEGSEDIDCTNPTGLNEGGFVDLPLTFTLAAGESMEFTLTLTPDTIGEKARIYRWLVGDNQYFQIHATYIVVDNVGSISRTEMFFNNNRTEGTYVLQLTEEPTDEVTIYLEADPGIILSQYSFVFNNENWNIAQTVTVQRDEEALTQVDLPITDAVIRHVVYSAHAAIGTDNSAYFNEGKLSDLVVHFDPYIILQEGTVSDSDTENKDLLFRRCEPVVSTSCNQYGIQNEIVILDLNIISDSFSSAVQWSIDWGDNQRWNSYRIANSLRVIHQYTESGVYDINLTIINAQGDGYDCRYYLGSCTVDSLISNAAILDLVLESSEDLDGTTNTENIVSSFFGTEMKEGFIDLSFLDVKDQAEITDGITQTTRDAAYKDWYLVHLKELELFPSTLSKKNLF